MAYAYQSSRGERYPKDKSLPYLVKPGLFFVVVVVVVVVFFFFLATALFHINLP